MLYVRAYAARENIEAQPRTLAFGTLAQTLLQPAEPGESEVFLLYPWDFIPELDWRSGFPETPLSCDTLFEQALELAHRLTSRSLAKLVYIPAPVPPIFSDGEQTQSLLNSLLGLVRGLDAQILSPDVFTLGGHLSTGSPIRGDRLSEVARTIWELAGASVATEFKVLVTDLDGVMWSGVIGEDGVDGIACGPEGRGYSHFLYQSLLRKLKASGVVLAAVTRNDDALALSPFEAGKLQLAQDDFVAIIASYAAKSPQIQLLAERLNLGLDSFVFVDDNPVELAEVSTALPAVTCLQFPKADDDLVAFFRQLGKLFNRKTITSEDRERSEMYRRSLKATPPSGAKGADIQDFLRGLEMKLCFHDRSSGHWDRALQLINKTNQFNLNGRRLTEEAFKAKLAAGARVYSGSLTDRTGNHGEVIACLVEPDGLLSSFIMSCRVFQRRLEYAFVALVLQKTAVALRLEFAGTERNSPFAQFLADPAFGPPENDVFELAQAFTEAHREDLNLFELDDGTLD